MSNENVSPSSEGSVPPKRKLTATELVDQLAGSYESPAEETPEVTTPEAATRTDNNDHDYTQEKLDAARKSKESDDEEAEDVVSEDEDADEEEEDSEPEEVEEDVEEESDEADEDDDEAETDPEDEVVYTTPEGEEITLRELKRGFLREADYTRKTQEVAEQRKQIEQAMSQVSEHNNLVAEHLNLALSVVEPQLAELAAIPWDQLAAADPYEYAEKRALFDQAQARYGHLRQAAEATLAQEQAQIEAARKQMLAQEQQKLAMALPELADPKTGRKLANEIREYALSQGLSEQEASTITDHRLIVMLNKARMYDQLNKSSVSAAKKKISKAPKKSVRAGQPPSKSDIAKGKRQAMKAKVKETGSADALVELLLGNG